MCHTEKAEDLGGWWWLAAGTQNQAAWSSCSGHGGPFRRKGLMNGIGVRSTWDLGGGWPRDSSMPGGLCNCRQGRSTIMLEANTELQPLAGP